VLNILDDPLGPFNVDFRKYDNWEFKVGGEFYEHDYRPFDFETDTSADGLLDFMLIYYKGKSTELPENVGGRADLGFGSSIIKDGISIANTMGVIGFKAEKFGLEHTIWISAHEIGHHQFGITNFNVGSHFNGRNDNFGNLQSFGLMTTAMGHQFSAYERYRLGWLDPIYATSSLNAYIINDTHKSNSDNALIIPVRYDIYGRMAEYFLLENYHTTHAYSGANPFLTKNLFNHVFTKGIIVYHVSEENFDWPTLSKIDIESAEGLFDWEVIEGASTPNDRLDDLIAPITKDVINGFDERDNITAIAGTVTYTDYLALTPSSSTLLNDQKRRRYNSDDWLGDQEDLFSIEYNKVFTKWSNPSSVKFDTFDSYKGFEIISYNSSTHQYNIKVGLNYNDIINLSPSKPQNFKVVQNGNNAYLTWNQNNEPDVLLGGKYKIYRTITNGGNPVSWVNVATVNHPTTNWTDPDLYITGTGSKKVFYSVSALDNTNLESVKSEHDFLYFNNLLQKQTQEKEDIAKVIEYKLQDNYPNPFNPSTTIKYELPQESNVKVSIYSILGEELTQLVNTQQSAGYYNVTWNAHNLSSGIYLVRISANSINGNSNFVDVKKMLLIK
jgi:hypothetical protein